MNTVMIDEIRSLYRTGGASRVLKRMGHWSVLRNPLLPQRFYWRIAPSVYRHRFSMDLDDCSIPVDPFKIERVDPNRITRFTGRKYPQWIPALDQFGTIRGGDWDRGREIDVDPRYDGSPPRLYMADRFEDTPLHEALELHFTEGVRWAETDFVQMVLDQIEAGSGHIWNGCTSEKDVTDRCQQIDELYVKMRDQGCRSQRELARNDPADDRIFPRTLQDEIRVDVGRSGALLFVDGRHRLSIAKILDLGSVPIVFGVRHTDWMEICRARYEQNRSCDHPDLRRPDKHG